MDKTYCFLPYFFATFFVVVIACFYQSYFSEFPDFQNVISPIGNVPITITTVTHFHATMVVLWLLLLIIQPFLVVNKKVELHRQLGKVSYLLVALMVFSFVLIINQTHSREKNIPVFAANLFDFPVFMVFYGLAIYYRKKTAYHSRFMIMSIIPFINPALARVSVPGLPVQLGLWVLLFGIEFFNRKMYKPYLIGFGYYIFNLAVVVYLLLANPALLEKLRTMIWGDITVE
ncbi:hypothetical protein [Runella aurantiaca]|nr:hypothetical protein [Runella aurantiaca]